MAAALITVAQAKAHLAKPDVADDDPDLLQKMGAAEASILTFVRKESYGRTVSEAWIDPTSVPDDVQHAILLQLGRFDRFRGDDATSDQPPVEPGSELDPAIMALLRRWSSPAIA